jgi:hypothetical protein
MMFESFFIQKASVIVKSIITVYKNSYTDVVLNRFSDYLNQIKQDSIVYRFTMKNEKISGWWHNSLIYSMVQKIVDFIVNFIGQVLQWLSESSDDSVVGKVYGSFIKPLNEIGSLVAAISAVLSGFIIMNIAAAYHLNALTTFGFIARLFILFILLIPACTSHNKLLSAVQNSRVFKFFQWIIES